MSAETLCPGSPEDLAELIAEVHAKGGRLTLCGGGSKASIGAPTEAARVDMRGLSGVVDYDPAELVLTVKPGTPLAEVETLLASQGQMLAFEPFDHGPIFGRPAGAATIGGVIAAGVAGSRRLSRGQARDHLLGFKAVSGRGEMFVAGAKVTKNVTGYDLPKLACGSWGRLFAMTELNIKTLPRSETTLTLALDGLSPGAAVEAMSRACGSQASASAAAHQDGVTALRLSGFAPSVAARRALLEGILEGAGHLRVMEPAEAADFWNGLKTITALADSPLLWRVVVAPRRAAQIIAALGDARWLMDWAGGMLWVGCGVDVRTVAEAAGGHAQLIRAPVDMRSQIPAFHPRPSALAALETRVRLSFDPHGVFETGRFGGQ